MTRDKILRMVASLPHEIIVIDKILIKFDAVCFMKIIEIVSGRARVKIVD